MGYFNLFGDKNVVQKHISKCVEYLKQSSEKGFWTDDIDHNNFNIENENTNENINISEEKVKDKKDYNLEMRYFNVAAKNGHLSVLHKVLFFHIIKLF